METYSMEPRKRSDSLQGSDKRSHPLRLSIIPALGLVLAACGGGGGGGGGGGNPLTLDRDDVVEPGVTRLTNAARNAPRSGSVTQGTRASSGVTTDRVRFVNNRVEIETGDGVRRTRTAPTSRTSEPSVLEAEDERAVALVFTELTLTPGNADPVAAAFDPTDPVTFGLWAYTISDDDIVWGVFADGLTASLTPLGDIPTTGTANYSGTTVLAYRLRNPDGTESGFGAGEVALTADFGNGEVNGTITDLHAEDDDGNFGALDDPITINLEAASIDTSADGGFFRGDTSFDASSPLTATGEGKWGGQFFGSSAQNVAGTWGIAGTLNDGSTETHVEAVGAFGAER